MDSSPSLCNKRHLIEAFVDLRREAEFDAIIADEGMRADETRDFMDRACRDGVTQASGTAIAEILPPVSRFAADGGHGETKQRVLAELGEFFERFFGLS